MARHKVHERRLARESALALLYSSDITEQAASQIVESGAYPADDVDLPEYAEALILGVAEHREDIDAQLEAIKTRIKNDDVRFIAYEPNMPDEMLQLMVALEDELGLKRVTLHNISSLTASQIESGKDYLSLMYENLSVLDSIATSSAPSGASNETVNVEAE